MDHELVSYLSKECRRMFDNIKKIKQKRKLKDEECIKEEQNRTKLVKVSASVSYNFRNRHY